MGVAIFVIWAAVGLGIFGAYVRPGGPPDRLIIRAMIGYVALTVLVIASLVGLTFLIPTGE